MRHVPFALLSLALLACPGSVPPPAAAPPATAAPGRASSCLSIVSWNDMHGQLGPDDPVVDTGRIKAGGVIAVADEVDAIRASGDATVVVDAGDLFTGPLESTVAEGAPIVAAYNVIGVDAAAIGNHDFDFGPVGYAVTRAQAGVTDEAGSAGPRGALMARMSEAHFPFLSANVVRHDGRPFAWKNFADHVVIRRGGFRVGVVGYTTVETPTTTLKPNVADLDFDRTSGPRVAASIRAARAEGADVVVLVAHASLEGDLPSSLDDPADPKGEKRVGEMAALVDALGTDRPDLIAAGHRHAWMIGRVRGVPIVSSSQHGIGLTRVRFCAPPSGGAPALAGVERRVAVANDPPRTALGAHVKDAVRPYLDRVRAEADALVASVPRTCAPQGLTETAYAEQVARAVRAHAADVGARPDAPVVAIVNSGGLRAPLLAGEVKFSDLFQAIPFENAVSVCVTTRRGLERAIDNASHRPMVRERFPFGVAGAKLTMKRRPDGMLDLVDLQIEGAKTPDARVWLAVPDFLLWGGDGFLNGVECTQELTSATRIRDAWRALLTEEKGGCDGSGTNVTVQ